MSLMLADALGRKVKTVIADESITAGTHHKTIDMSTLPGGIYFVTLQAGETKTTKKVMKH